MKRHIKIILVALLVISILTLLGSVYFFCLKKFMLKEVSNLKETVELNDTEVEEVVEEPSIEGKYDHDEYQTKIDEIAKKYRAVGVSVALVDNGKVIDTFSYGSGIKGQLEMTEDTKIRIASVSKIFVGLATMISVDNGTMSLDEDIGKYWGFKVKTYASGDVITPRSILTHTSSLYDTEDISATYYSNMVYRLKSGSGIRRIVSGNIKNYNYNNYAIDVLGMTVELANNKTLDEILSEKIYDKLDIDAAFYAGDLKDTSKIATFYMPDGSVGYSAARSASLYGGTPASRGWAFAGGVTISAKDLGKIIALLSNDGSYDGTSYLSENIIKELENHENNNLGDYWQCQPLCYKTNAYSQEEFYYHTGYAYGIYSLAGYNPITKQGVAVLTSGANGQKDEHEVACVCGEIADVLLNIGE